MTGSGRNSSCNDAKLTHLALKESILLFDDEKESPLSDSRVYLDLTVSNGGCCMLFTISIQV